MKRKLLFTRIVVCCMFILIISAHMIDAAPPKYPQTFILLSGEQNSFGFPLTRAGSIEADVQWQGGIALAVSLVNMSGRTVSTLNQVKSPARLSYNASDKDLADGMLWQVVIAYPKSSSNSMASGSISIRYPEVDSMQLSRLEKSLAAQAKSSFQAPASMPAAHKAKVIKALNELDQSNQQRIQKYKMQADTQYATATRSGKAAVPLKVKGFPSAMQSQAPIKRTTAFLTAAQKNALTANKIPSLIEAVPSQAGPGQQVTLYGKDFSVQNRMYQASFTVRGEYIRYENTNNPNMPVNIVKVPPLVLTVPVESVTQLPDDRQQLVVHAPVPPAGSNLSPYEGDVSVKSTGFASNIVPFMYQVSVPILQSIDPYWTKAGEQAVINGSQLAGTDTLHMVLNDGQDRVIPFTLLSSGEIRFTVPQYSARSPFSAKVYVTRVVNGITIASQEAYCMLWGTDLDITALNVNQAPMDSPVIITGVNIEPAPVVEFQLSGRTYNGTVTQSNQTTIYVKVPKIGGVAANTPCQVRVKCGNKTSATTLTFTYIPTYVHELFRVCAPQFKTDVQFGETLTNIYPSGLGGQGDGCHYSLWCAAAGEFENGESFIYGGHDTTQYLYFGKTGYDDYFARSTLKNGWKLERVEVTLDPRCRGNVGAYLAENGIGTSVPRARIRWWGDRGGDIQYIVTLFITGPYGTSWY